MSKWIKKDDKVLIICGNDKGKLGTVLRRQGDRILVQGLNMRKRHLKRRSQTVGPQIVDMETPIHVSNACLCNAKGERIRLKVRDTTDGGRELYYRDEEREVIHRHLKK